MKKLILISFSLFVCLYSFGQPTGPSSTDLFQWTNHTFEVRNAYGSLSIGPLNTGWCHFYTDRSTYYFNKGIWVNGNIGSYNSDLNLMTAGTTRLTILNSNGNVGIGTTNPGPYKLNVNGTIGVTGALALFGAGLNPITSYSDQQMVINADYTNYHANYFDGAKGSDQYHTNMPFYFKWRGDQFSDAAMVISGNGNIGIGTTTSLAYKLNVNGGITCTEVKVVSSIASDYVFKPTYKLSPLNEVEAYVKENSHLPEIPSASELKETGYKLGEMDDLLLRKVEELTLYVIEQNKRIEALENENALLKK